MHLLLAVIDDLYTFARDAFVSAFGALVSKKSADHPNLLSAAPDVPLIGGNDTAAESDVSEEPEELEEDTKPSTFRSVVDVIESPAAKNTVMYTGSERTPLYRRPAMEFDGIIAHIPYGAMVMVLESRGRWSRIVYRSLEGWVLRDELLDRSAYVYPDFTIGEPNHTDDPNTLRVRACIADEFGAGKAEMSLQSSEYVLYRLAKKGVQIVWPDVRPRIEGNWHEILKGREGVQIGVHPCSGCIMEYIYEDGIGHLAYVEAVFPDDTLSISEANFPSDGIYNERVLTREEWRELRPVFMDIR